MKLPGLVCLLFALCLPQIYAADAPAKVPYPLQTCIVSGEHLEAGQMVVYVHKEEGQPDRVMHFCCRKCLAKFKADPAKYLKELDEAAAKKAVKKG
ncbi:MAG TPA: hypothetical protein VG936_05380 [Lacunisphaera sp.]|nr:hypothetical protein [Lacunisphaera sp.]